MLIIQNPGLRSSHLLRSERAPQPPAGALTPCAIASEPLTWGSQKCPVQRRWHAVRGTHAAARHPETLESVRRRDGLWPHRGHCGDRRRSPSGRLRPAPGVSGDRVAPGFSPSPEPRAPTRARRARRPCVGRASPGARFLSIATSEVHVFCLWHRQKTCTCEIRRKRRAPLWQWASGPVRPGRLSPGFPSAMFDPPPTGRRALQRDGSGARRARTPALAAEA